MLEFVVTRLTALLPVIAGLSKDQRELRDAALTAISEALTETALYVKRVQRTGQREPETQEQLVRLWSRAAVPMRHLDEELSEICEYKAEYWLDPDVWEPDQTGGVSIELDTVKERYRGYLN